jgi:hypothetical protein
MVQTRRTLIAQLGTAFASSAITLGAEPHRSKAADKNAVEKIRIGQIGVGHGHASKISVYRNSADLGVTIVPESRKSSSQSTSDMWMMPPIWRVSYEVKRNRITRMRMTSMCSKLFFERLVFKSL